MALFLQHRESACRWGIWKMEESYEDLCALLPPALVSQAEQSFPALQRRIEWLSVRALLAEMLGTDAVVCYLPSGKPCLAHSETSISISHTRGYVTLILGSRPVGIDIEQYGRRVHRVASKFMREDEVAGAWEGDDTWGLLLHWSAKEVMFKCLDEAEVDFRDHLQIFPFTLQREGTFSAREYRTAARRDFLIHYLLHPDFVLTWTVEV